MDPGALCATITHHHIHYYTRFKSVNHHVLLYQATVSIQHIHSTASVMQSVEQQQWEFKWLATWLRQKRWLLSTFRFVCSPLQREMTLAFWSWYCKPFRTIVGSLFRVRKGFNVFLQCSWAYSPSKLHEHFRMLSRELNPSELMKLLQDSKTITWIIYKCQRALICALL